MIIGMYHGKTEFARRRIEEWKKLHPDARIHIFDPKEARNEQASSSRTVDTGGYGSSDSSSVSSVYWFSEDWVDWPRQGHSSNG